MEKHPEVCFKYKKGFKDKNGECKSHKNIMSATSCSDALKSLKLLASGLGKASPVSSYCRKIQKGNITQLQDTENQGSAPV